MFLRFLYILRVVAVAVAVAVTVTVAVAVIACMTDENGDLYYCSSILNKTKISSTVL